MEEDSPEQKNLKLLIMLLYALSIIVFKNDFKIIFMITTSILFLMALKSMFKKTGYDYEKIDKISDITKYLFWSFICLMPMF